MNFAQVFLIALRALRRNKARSVLTALGIIFGVAAVIAMVAIGAGARESVNKVFTSMGTNLLIVTSGAANMGGVRGASGSQLTLTWDDLRAMKSELTNVIGVAPELRASAQVVVSEQNWNTSVTGTAPEYFTIRNWSISKGSFFTQSDVDTGSKVCVLGNTVVDNLFGPGADPIGQTVRINNTPFEIVGVTSVKGQSPMGQDQDDAVWIPYSTFRAKIRGGLGNFVEGIIDVSAQTQEDTARVQRSIETLLRERHRIGADGSDDFSVRNLSELAAGQQQSMATLTTLLAIVAAVSLVVGGIGVMNIMLVSVTERTREIGLRVAVGATPVDILLQFLVEAMTLALAGGLIGILLGLGTAIFASTTMHWPLLVEPAAIILSFGVSAAVGIIFGLYPASKASRLDPIDALRYE